MGKQSIIVMAFGAGLFALIIFASLILLRKPAGDREWSSSLTKITTFQESAPSEYIVNNLRAWEYGPQGALRKEWERQTVDTGSLKEVWFFLEPFVSNDLFAHSLLSFVFEEQDGSQNTLSVSVEARKEAGEAYSAIRGAFREYELMYVWSTEKDVLTRIAVKLDHPLYAYKLDITDEQARVIFDHFVQTTNQLAEHPRFYNTFHSNCTNELAKAVNKAFPGSLPWSPAWIMTGRSAHWLYKNGFLGEQDLPYGQKSQAANIRDHVKKHALEEGKSFDDLWRRELSLTANN